MPQILKDLLFSAIGLLATYFGFIHDIEIIKFVIGVLYTISLIYVSVAVFLLYMDFRDLRAFKGKLQNNYKLYHFFISLIVIPTTCWIFYMTHSYNYLAVYITLVVLSALVRYKIYAIVKSR